MSDKNVAAPPTGDGGEKQSSHDERAAAGPANDVDSVAHKLSKANLGALVARGAERKRHQFWETQPVAQFTDDKEEGLPEGPIEPPQRVEDVRQEPYPLPPSFDWCVCDMGDPGVLEEVYSLLTNNYVEDDDNMFRFDYSAAFIIWALQPHGYYPDWHIGVRVKATNKLVALITGVPASIRVDGNLVRMAEINFLCVHKKLRSKRLAPVLIREITRRVHLRDIWQASYTAGVVLPRPITSCRYWHRSLQPKKLIDVGFSHLAPRMTLSRTVKLYKLPDAPATPGFRKMRPEDVPQVAALLTEYLLRFRLAPVLSEDEVARQLLPREDVVDCYVVENLETKRVTDFSSFYTLPSTIIGNDTYKAIKAAYSFYNVAKATPLTTLMNDTLIVAKNAGYDVFNALDVMDNVEFLKELKFGIGDGHLQYYLYNYRVAKPMTPQDVGLVLL
eukprot:jgi/Mesvir1/13007/Mv06010-RA.1